MKLWLLTVAVLLAIPALRFHAQAREQEAARAAYAVRMANCLHRYPRYRCEIELAQFEPKERL